MNRLPKDALDDYSAEERDELEDDYPNWGQATDAAYDWLSNEERLDCIELIEYGFLDDNVWVETDLGSRCCGNVTVFVTVQGRKGVIRYSFGH